MLATPERSLTTSKEHQTLSFDAYLKFIEDDFLGAQRLNPKTDERPDPRPDVRENVPQLGNLVSDFDFNQKPRAPLLLPTNPRKSKSLTRLTRLSKSLAALLGAMRHIFYRPRRPFGDRLSGSIQWCIRRSGRRRKIAAVHGSQDRLGHGRARVRLAVRLTQYPG